MFGAQRVAPRTSNLRTNPFDEPPHRSARLAVWHGLLAQLHTRPHFPLLLMSAQERRLDIVADPASTVGPSAAASRSAARATSTAWSPSLPSLLGRRSASSTTATLSEDDTRQTAGKAGSAAFAGVDRKRSRATADWLLVVVGRTFLFVPYPTCR